MDLLTGSLSLATPAFSWGGGDLLTGSPDGPSSQNQEGGEGEGEGEGEKKRRDPNQVASCFECPF